MIKLPFSRIAITTLVLLTLISCGGGGGSNTTAQDTTAQDTTAPATSTSDTTPDIQSKSISGGGVKGPLANAVVTVYAFDTAQTGSKGAVVTTASTGADAAIIGLALPFPLNPPYIMEFTSNAGTTDITTKMAPVITTMRTVITQALLDNGEQIYATPLTTMAVDIVAANSPASPTIVQFEAALTAAAAQVVSTLGFGMSGDIDIFDVPPLVDSTTDTADEQANVAAYRSAVEALTAVVYEMKQQSAGSNVDAVLSELSLDLADGEIDGLVGVTSEPSTIFTSTTLDLLAQDPATLIIPNSGGKKVAEVQQILIDEKATTGSATSTDDLDTTSGSIRTTTKPAETSPDKDNDGVLNANDAFPLDSNEQLDSDNDGVGNNADLDDDNDGVADSADAFPLDPTEQTDTDSDGTGNNADTDDDGDNTPDSTDDFPLDSTKQNATDVDNDGWPTDQDVNDNNIAFPGTTFVDTDGDGIGDETGGTGGTDTDDDNDGVVNGADAFPRDQTEQTDTDNNGVGNNADTDDDGDGTLDVTDAFPLDSSEQKDTDNDGKGNNEDTDDDNDGRLDTTEDGAGGSDDYDGDGTPNREDIDSDNDGVLDSIDFDPYNDAITFNFAPNAVSSAVTTDEDAAVTVTLGVTDDGIASGALTYTNSNPANGLLSGTAPNFSYTPNADFNGVDSFTFSATDGAAKISNTSTVTITVTPVNDTPIIAQTGRLVVTMDEDGSPTVFTPPTIDATDTDTEDDNLTWTLSSAASNGTATVSGTGASPTITYAPTLNFNGGPDSFEVSVSDGNSSASITIDVTITPVNDAPVAVDDAVTTVEDTAATNIVVLTNDTDVDGDALTVVGVTPTATNGTIVDNNDGTFNYTPNLNFNGQDSFAYGISDGNGGNDIGTVTITVTAVNNIPVGVDDSATTDEDTAVMTGNVLTNDTDVDGDTLSIVAGNPSDATKGTVVNNNNGTFTYTPTANDNGADSFTYTVNDGNGGSATAIVNITITAVSDAPVANNDSTTTNEDTDVTTGNVLTNDTDADGNTLTVAAGNPTATKGSVVNNGDSTFTYSPNPDTNGTDSFSYTVNDGTGSNDTATVTITVTPVNDAPVAIADTFNAGAATLTSLNVLANDSDVDGDSLTITNVSAPSRSATITIVGGTVNFTDSTGAGETTFSYDISDDFVSQTGISVTVTVVANVPPVTTDDSAATAEDTSVTTVNVLTNDTDGGDGPDALTIDTADTESINGGVVTNNNNGTFTYSPMAHFNGADSFTYTVSDGSSTSVGTINISVTAINDPPIAVDDTATTNEDTAITTTNVLTNDSDDDSDELTVATGDPTATKGTVVNNNNGTFTYTPSANLNGSDSFSYTVIDGNAGSATATVSVTVTSVNDLPTISGTPATSIDNDATYTFIPTASDVDGQALTFSIQNMPVWATFTLADGTLSGIPALSDVGGDLSSIIISVISGSDTVALPAFAITVNSAPVGSAVWDSFNWDDGSTWQ